MGKVVERWMIGVYSERNQSVWCVQELERERRKRNGNKLGLSDATDHEGCREGLRKSEEARSDCRRGAFSC